MEWPRVAENSAESNKSLWQLSGVSIFCSNSLLVLRSFFKYLYRRNASHGHEGPLKWYRLFLAKSEFCESLLIENLARSTLHVRRRRRRRRARGRGRLLPGWPAENATAPWSPKKGQGEVEEGG